MAHRISKAFKNVYFLTGIFSGFVFVFVFVCVFVFVFVYDFADTLPGSCATRKHMVCMPSPFEFHNVKSHTSQISAPVHQCSSVVDCVWGGEMIGSPLPPICLCLVPAKTQHTAMFGKKGGQFKRHSKPLTTK